MHVVQLARRFVREEWGGTETVIVETTRELACAGIESVLYASKALSKVKSESIHGITVQRFGYSYTRLGLTKKNKLLLDKRGGDLYSITLFIKLLFCKTDLFHLHTLGRIGAMVRLVSKIRKIPYVVSIHGGVTDIPKEQMDALLFPIRRTFNWGKPLDLLLQRDRVLDDAEAVICLSEGEKIRLEQMYPNKKIVRLPNGVNSERFAKAANIDIRNHLGIVDQSRIVLSVGSFYAQKNQLTLLKAFQQFSRKFPTYQLVMAGVVYDRDYYNQLLSYVRDNNLESYVKFAANLGYDSDELIALYQQSDFFVLPSHYETFGIVVLEAWANNLPVIAGNSGGLTTTINNHVNGLFFDTTSVSDLLSKMTTLATSPQLAKELADNAMSDLNNYKWSSIASTLGTIYKGAIAK